MGVVTMSVDQSAYITSRVKDGISCFWAAAPPVAAAAATNSAADNNAPFVYSCVGGRERARKKKKAGKWTRELRFIHHE